MRPLILFVVFALLAGAAYLFLAPSGDGEPQAPASNQQAVESQGAPATVEQAQEMSKASADWKQMSPEEQQKLKAQLGQRKPKVVKLTPEEIAEIRANTPVPEGAVRLEDIEKR